jgi:Na+-transporting methylmalonyl-CoA/oxaloacetate decarboxylase beta subunit
VENLYSLKETKFIIEMVLAFILMFSLLVLVPLGLFGVLVLGYLFRKMKVLQKQMR